ncbi:HAMP domain-containing sensor histidine kinase [Nibrella saemangeumensis]|uniref:histidine kinase n=1 Tax=Nibrella saemangeumensis TaxID=1084526 RepID=A0ABP8N106_9BACT
MLKQSYRYVFLWLSAIFLLLAAIHYVWLDRGVGGDAGVQYQFSVQNRVLTGLRQSKQDLENLERRLQKSGVASFDALLFQTQFPYYVFRNGQLVFWSDHRFVPDYVTISSVGSQPKLLDFNQGQFLTSRRQVRHAGETYDLVSLINLFRRYQKANNYLRSGYNPAIFVSDPVAISARKQALNLNIFDGTPSFLFSVGPPQASSFRNYFASTETIVLALGSILLLGLFVLWQIRHLRRNRRADTGFLWLLGYLVMLRVFLLYFEIPFVFGNPEAFNPKYFSSLVAPSLGDMLINAAFLAAGLFYLTRFYFRFRSYQYLLQQSQAVQISLSVLGVVLSYLVFALAYSRLVTICANPRFGVDITLSIRFTDLKIVGLLIIIGIATSYFLVMHLLSSLFIRFNKPASKGLIWFMVGTVVSMPLLLGFGLLWEPVWLLNSLYFVMLFLARFPRALYRFRYQTSLYLIFSALLCALLPAYVVFDQGLRKEVFLKQEFGRRLLKTNDELGELLLDKALKAAAIDPQIRRSFLNDPLFARERIQQQVKSVILDRYFDTYDVQVLSFGANGLPLDQSDTDEQYATLAARYQLQRYKTQYRSLFLINESAGSFARHYVGFAPVVGAGGELLGYVVLTLKNINDIPRSVYKELLVDSKFIQTDESHDFSYALLGPDQQVLYSSGQFNYEAEQSARWFGNPELFSKGITSEDYRHLGLMGKDGRTIIVSSPNHPLYTLFANFSFLFLLLVLTVSAVIIYYAMTYGMSQFSINYTTRIQLMLNMAFFIPLLLVITISLSTIKANNTQDQEQAYVKNTSHIAFIVKSFLDEHRQGKRSLASLEEQIKGIASEADLDINLFDDQGHLYTTTRPIIYESRHLSRYINPLAYTRLVEHKEKGVLLNESLGNKEYYTTYVPLRAADGRMLGTLSIPYFLARPELDRRIITITTSALNVFTLLFLLFLILSYFAANLLTQPLQILTQKIRRTSLNKLNEPLPWKSDDEIGLLISEYNRMLIKLEENKQALSQSEKVSAWQEMAKQVAHEIKNPLTPMKLTLQHLQRKIADPNTGNHQLFRQTFDSLLDQIENISDIATSFSDFAKMPLPRNEIFDLTPVVHKVVDLYMEDTQIHIHRQMTPLPVMIRGDRQLMSRILTNLILNGIQSVPPDRTPQITVRLYTDSVNVHLEVHDNGAGIPKSIHTKVFLPNFSTKHNGSGLGLAIAKRGIEHAGGSIWFDSEEAIGTTFYISLPQVVVAPTPNSHSKAKA